ncbi:MAG: hypothetical protein RLZZ244_2308, partial [Verrucomicrobiota bacterium]
MKLFALLPLILLPLPVLSAPAPAHDPTPAARIPDSHQSFLRAYCLDCHNAEKEKGKVRLDNLPFAITDARTAERWQKILGVLNSGEMPPEDHKQPAAEEKATLLETLSRQMVLARKALADTGGTSTMRRLNRREYTHTLHDLLDVTLLPKDLPADDDSGSFDTIGSGLFFSADQFQQYLKLARAALDEAIVTSPKPKTRTSRREPETETLKHVRAQHDRLADDKKRFEAWKDSGKSPSEFGFEDEAEAKIKMALVKAHLKGYQTYLAEPATQSGHVLQTFTGLLGQDLTHLPHDASGLYRIRLRAAAMDPQKPCFLEIGLHGKRESVAEIEILKTLEIRAPLDAPQLIEFDVPLTKAGSHTIAIRERRPNTADAIYYLSGIRSEKNDGDAYRPTVWIDWVEWEGPLVSQWPPRAHQQLFGQDAIPAASDAPAARGLLERFAQRAFRGRPVNPEFLDRLMLHFHERVAAGEPFAEAIKTPLSILLASPSFLYLAEESSKTSARRPLSAVELANRLSYFLWSSPPDERLLQLAREQRLAQPEVLAQEVERMLEDARVNRFLSGFIHQWLHMVRLDFFQFNHRLYPRFDGSVKEAARREVIETFHRVLQEKLPLGTLLKSDFVVVNDVLADYYGIPGVQGESFRKVPVPAGLPRGGLLGMAAIHAMGSDGERSSPVERGAWVLRKLLNDPPPPAPANVPQLSRFSGKLMPARTLMQSHMEQPQCSNCHRRIDPIGYGLENFDAVGQWRDQEYTEIAVLNKVVRESKRFPIDPSGTLPNGRAFSGFESLRDALHAHESDLARGLLEHLIEFALGRPFSFSDSALVDSILESTRAQHHTPAALI